MEQKIYVGWFTPATGNLYKTQVLFGQGSRSEIASSKHLQTKYMNRLFYSKTAHNVSSQQAVCKQHSMQFFGIALLAFD